MHTHRIWDLPTRVFHWLLATAVIAAIVSAKLGGNAMDWHMRLGGVTMSLLVFRLLWGMLGGHWSRFRQWPLAPTALLRYVRGMAGPAETAGHTPTGSWAVVAMLVLLALQVATGLVADDEIATSGPLVGVVSDAISLTASRYHHGLGQLLLLVLIAMHLAAIGFYTVVKHEPLVSAMLTGDKPLDQPLPQSADSLANRWLALVLWLACLGLVFWVFQ